MQENQTVGTKKSCSRLQGSLEKPEFVLPFQQRLGEILTQTAGLHARGSVHRVAKQTVARHYQSHHPGHTGTWSAHKRALWGTTWCTLARNRISWGFFPSNLCVTRFVSWQEHQACASFWRFLQRSECPGTCWLFPQRDGCHWEQEGRTPPCKRRRWSPPAVGHDASIS